MSCHGLWEKSLKGMGGKFAKIDSFSCKIYLCNKQTPTFLWRPLTTQPSVFRPETGSFSHLVTFFPRQQDGENLWSGSCLWSHHFWPWQVYSLVGGDQRANEQAGPAVMINDSLALVPPLFPGPRDILAQTAEYPFQKHPWAVWFWNTSLLLKLRQDRDGMVFFFIPPHC